MSPNPKPLIIAGKHSGRSVTIDPSFAATWKNLENAALRGNHWALLAVKQLTALTTGVTDKGNVYVRPNADKNEVGNRVLTVFLPGLRATVLCLAESSYVVKDLVLDANYFSATEHGHERTRLGLYRAEIGDRGDWQANFVKNGNIVPEKGRLVTVADAGYETATDAAIEIVPRAMKSMGAAATNNVRRDGCDLHFTPGEKRLGGLRRYDALQLDDARASALHLAETMFQARDVAGVMWVADRGGSAVLTQAMQILVDRGVTLKSHTAYLYKPRTSPGNALQLAHKLELSLNEAFADTNWDLRGTASQWSVSGQRLSKKEDPYNVGYHAQSWLNGLVQAAGPAGVATAGAASLGASLPMMTAIVGVVGGAGVVCSLGQSLIEDMKHKFKR